MTGAPPEKMDLRCWVSVFGTMLGAFMAILDIQITNSSLADISGGIAATPDEGSWISTSYLIGEIITIPLTAWLSRIFTLRYYLLGNVALFLFCSAMCGLSDNLFEMICFRVGQGFSGGVFIPTALTVVTTRMPPHLRPIGTSMFGMTATLAPTIGPYLGGLLTDHWGWQWNFYINFIPGIVMFSTVYATIDAGEMQLSKLWQGDWIGIIALSIGLGSLVAMLEEGQRKDWFGNDFIRTCGILAAIFIPLFVIRELFFAPDPVVKLRLLAGRNLGVSTIIATMLGLGLYGCVYLIPVFLESVQGYSPVLVGETLAWVGLPQLFVFPFLPFLMKRVDLRLLIFIGSLIFAYSCYLNAYMTPEYGKDQFMFANIVRALGQPFTIVPVTQLAIAGLAPRDAGDASAIFNMFRNLGGSFGIALLSTITQRREQFHDFRIGETITASTPGVQHRLDTITSHLISHGIDPAAASQKAFDIFNNSVRKNANVMAYNDAFLCVAIGLSVGALAVWFCKKPNPQARPGPA
jgi:DHA2 family multidrug resistance protein